MVSRLCSFVLVFFLKKPFSLSLKWQIKSKKLHKTSKFHFAMLTKNYHEKVLWKICFNQWEARHRSRVCARFSDLISRWNQWWRREMWALFSLPPPTPSEFSGSAPVACENICFSSLIVSRSSARNVPSDEFEERRETDVFAGYSPWESYW